MHVLEAALVANTTHSASTTDHFTTCGQISPRPARLLPRAVAGFVVLGMAVALLDAAAPAQLPMLAGTSMTVR